MHRNPGNAKVTTRRVSSSSKTLRGLCSSSASALRQASPPRCYTRTCFCLSNLHIHRVALGALYNRGGACVLFCWHETVTSSLVRIDSSLGSCYTAVPWEVVIPRLVFVFSNHSISQDAPYPMERRIWEVYVPWFRELSFFYSNLFVSSALNIVMTKPVRFVACFGVFILELMLWVPN